MAIFTSFAASTSTNSSSTETCYYSQIKDCKIVPGWRETTIILSWVDWCSVFLGFTTLVMTSYVRRRRAFVRSETIPAFYKLSQYEIFLLLLSIACFFNASALSLSAYVSIRTVLMHSLAGISAWLIYVATIVFVNMVLKSSSQQVKVIRLLKKYFVPSLMIPITVTVAAFIYQGLYSDYTQYEDKSDEAKSKFNLIVIVVSLGWLITFVALLVVVIVARQSFASHLKAVMSSPMARLMSGSGRQSGDERSGQRSVTNASSKNGERSMSSSAAPALVASKQAEVILALQNAVSTLTWIVIGVVILMLFSLFYAASGFLIQSANFVYYSTLLVSYCTPFLISLFIFIFNLMNTTKQMMNVKDLELSLSEDSHHSASGFA
ncbi:hypothetical protein HDU97_008091 [Phlyctochytrium planicorne]|nr:hypothetical protein HDU97_008091 [Phlyctochytrium planicorne]